MHSSHSDVDQGELIRHWASLFRNKKGKQKVSLFHTRDAKSLDALRDAASRERLAIAPIAVSAQDGIRFFVFPEKWDRAGYFKQTVTNIHMEALKVHFLSICRRKMGLDEDEENKAAQMQILHSPTESTVLFGKAAPYVTWRSYIKYMDKFHAEKGVRKALRLALMYGKSPSDIWTSLSPALKSKSGLRATSHGFWWRHPNKDLCNRLQRIVMQAVESAPDEAVFWSDTNKIAHLFTKPELSDIRAVVGKWGLNAAEFKSLVVHFTQIYSEGQYGWDAFGVYAKRPSDTACLEALGLAEKTEAGHANKTVFPAFSILRWNQSTQNDVLVLLLNYSLWTLQSSIKAQKKRATIRYTSLAVEVNSILANLCEDEVLDDETEKRIQRDALALQCECTAAESDAGVKDMCTNCKTIVNRLECIPAHRICHLELSTKGIRYVKAALPHE